MKKVLRLGDENVFVTTRHFGLELHKTDELGAPANREKFLNSFSEIGLRAPSRFVYLNQVHGSRVAVLENTEFPEPFTFLPETDAVISNVRDLGLLVMTADCLSIFFLAGDWVGLAHAGWRGTKDKISSKTLQTIAKKSGWKPETVKIVFGPCIRACHYEVGEEFKNYFSSETVREREGRLTFDLVLENKKELLKAGAGERNISDSGICTVCQNRDFYSYRKEKETAGRMISIISRAQLSPPYEGGVGEVKVGFNPSAFGTSPS